ncbi:MAG: hypothetical protein ACYCPT_03905 [Acidimicrobiales bacterium]
MSEPSTTEPAASQPADNVASHSSTIPKSLPVAPSTASLAAAASHSKQNSEFYSKKLSEPHAEVPVSVKSAVWRKHAGTATTTECFVKCGETVSVFNFECAMLVSESKGGKLHVDNLRPVCKNCLASIGEKNIADFMDQYGFA